MSRLENDAETLLAFLQNGLVLLEARGIEASEAMLTCLADATVVLADLSRVNDHPRIRSAKRSLVALLWSDAAASLAEHRGPERWAVNLGRCFIDTPRFQADLISRNQLEQSLKEDAGIVLDLGPPWRPWEVWAVQRRAGVAILPGPPDAKPAVDHAEMRGEADYVICHVVIYSTDFGRERPPPWLLERAEPLLGASCDRHARQTFEDLGLETLLSYRFLTGRWHRTLEIWLSEKIPAFAGGLQALLAQDMTPDQFYRLYHPALLALRVLLDPFVHRNHEYGGFDHE